MKMPRAMTSSFLGEFLKLAEGSKLEFPRQLQVRTF